MDILKDEGVRYRKYYSEWGSDYITSLKAFLRNEKPFIDAAIKINPHYFSQSRDNVIGFIPTTDFEKRLEKINLYRQKVLQQSKSFE